MTIEVPAPSQDALLEPAEPKRVQDLIESFETAHGSVYTYDESGKTTRFKTATGETLPPQDLTVFVNLGLDQQQDVLAAYRTKNPTQKTKVYVVERQADDQPRVVRTVDEVTQPDKLFLAIFRNGVMSENAPASLFPEVGANVFDTRHYLEDGLWKTERHLGNKVTKVTQRQ